MKVYILILFAFISCTSKSKFSHTEKIHANYFIEALDLDNRSTKISNTGEPFEVVKREDIQQMLDLKTQALAKAEQIPESVLEKMHKELPKYYSKYKKGLQLRINNLKDGNAESEIEGTQLLTEWADWYDKHLKEIKVPKVKGLNNQ